MDTQFDRCIAEDDKCKVGKLHARKMSLRLMFAIGFCSRSTSRMASSRYSSTTPTSPSLSLSLLIFFYSVVYDCLYIPTFPFLVVSTFSKGLDGGVHLRKNYLVSVQAVIAQ
jgi:hypothetical protein